MYLVWEETVISWWWFCKGGCCDKAVSYTHLDVYKRQHTHDVCVQARRCSFCGLRSALKFVDFPSESFCSVSADTCLPSLGCSSLMSPAEWFLCKGNTGLQAGWSNSLSPHMLWETNLFWLTVVSHEDSPLKELGYMKYHVSDCNHFYISLRTTYTNGSKNSLLQWSQPPALCHHISKTEHNISFDITKLLPSIEILQNM